MHSSSWRVLSLPKRPAPSEMFCLYLLPFGKARRVTETHSWTYQQFWPFPTLNYWSRPVCQLGMEPGGYSQLLPYWLRRRAHCQLSLQDGGLSQRVSQIVSSSSLICPQGQLNMVAFQHCYPLNNIFGIVRVRWTILKPVWTPHVIGYPFLPLLLNTAEIGCLPCAALASCGQRLANEAVRVAVRLKLGLNLCTLHQCHCEPLVGYSAHCIYNSERSNRILKSQLRCEMQTAF